MKTNDWLIYYYLQTPASPGVPNIYTIHRVSSFDQVSGSQHFPHLFTTPYANDCLILWHCPAQGMYTCVAKNVVGKAYVAAYLQVAGSPHLYLEWVAVVLFVFYRQLSLNIVGAK